MKLNGCTKILLNFIDPHKFDKFHSDEKIKKMLYIIVVNAVVV